MRHLKPPSYCGCVYKDTSAYPYISFTMPTEIPGSMCLCMYICLMALTGCVAQLSETYSEQDLKSWQPYIANEQSITIGRILSQKGLSFVTALRGLYDLTKFYSTCRGQNIQFDDRVLFHSIWTVCSRLHVSVSSSTKRINHRLEIRTPKALGLNITTLRFGSEHDRGHFCKRKAMSVVTRNNKPGDVICGNPYLGRSSLVPDHIITVYFRHQYHMESVLEISLHIQGTARLRRSVDNFTVENVEAHFFSLNLQSINGKDYGAEVVAFAVSYDSRSGFYNTVPAVYVFPSNCSSDLSFAVYDGPYAGVMSTKGLLSPFQLLVEGFCADIPTSGYLTYTSSIGDLTVVIRYSPNHSPLKEFSCEFEYVPAVCPGESCTTNTVEVAHNNIQMWTFMMPQRPLIQIVEFVTKTPDSYINLKLEVREANVPRPSDYNLVSCPTEGIFIHEQHFVGLVCSGEGFSKLNRSMQETGGLQFNIIPVTIVLKVYPQTTKLNLTVWHTGTSCFGRINACFNRNEFFTRSLHSVRRENEFWIASCIPYFYARDVETFVDVHLYHNCFFQWNMIEFDITIYYFDWQCTYNFYAPQNRVYKWHIALDDKGYLFHGCFKVKYTATDYPLLFVSEGSREPPRPGVFVLAESMTLVSSYIHTQLLAKCNYLSLSMGLQVTGTALHLTNSFFCNNAKVSYRGDDIGTLPGIIYIFEPLHPCAELYLPSLSIEYSFTFNKYKIKNTPYNLRGRCCFVNLVFQGIRRIPGGFNDMLRYLIMNNKTCDSNIYYNGIPQSLVLQHFSANTFSEAFDITKYHGTPSFSIQYYFRRRAKVQRHTSNHTKQYGCLNGLCVGCSSRKCYSIHSSPGYFSWNEADMICHYNGSHLLSVNDAYEWSYISQLLEVLCINNFFLHLGLGIGV